MTQKILVVDDEPNVLRSIEKILKRSGYEVLTAASGAEGIKRAREDKPDAILLDLDMPDMDGGEVAHSLKATPQTSRIPFIFVTGLAREEDIADDHKIGSQYYIEKPFKSDKLLDLLKNLLEQKD